METIPTAEEYATEYDSARMPRGVSYHEDIGDLMIQFAKLHVIEALKQASEDASVRDVEWGLGIDTIVDKSSVLNAYPLINIK